MCDFSLSKVPVPWEYAVTMTSPEEPLTPKFSDDLSGEPFVEVPFPTARREDGPNPLNSVGYMPPYEESPDVRRGDGVPSAQETEEDPGAWF